MGKIQPRFPQSSSAAFVQPQVRAVRVTVTSAQILALFTTPVELVPTPGPDRVVIGLDAVILLRAGVVPYTDGGGLLVVGHGQAAIKEVTLTSAGFWDSAMDALAHAAFETAINWGVVSDLEDKPLVISNDTANPTLGTGTLEVTIFYVVVDV